MRIQQTVFWIVWTLLNVFHAVNAELIHDEAYYWVFSRYPAWGYYDHPPMTAWWILAGYALFQSELGVRLLFVIASTITLFICWKLSELQQKHFGLFVALTTSVLLVHFGGILAVPDVSLGFFAALYWLLLDRFIKKPSLQWAVALGFAMACMGYSKYHGAFIVIFTVAAYPGLLRIPNAWISALLAGVLLIPHFWWQHTHDWVTFTYHLFERQGSDPFRWKYLGEYLGGQLGLWGPFVAIPLLYQAFRYTTRTPFERALKVNALGFFVFFFFMSFKGHPEPNWTSPVLLPVLILALKRLAQSTRPVRWVYVMAVPSILALSFGRATMMYDFFPSSLFITRQFHGAREWTEAFIEKTGGKEALYSNAYQKPSRYYFYSGIPAAPQNNYGRNRRNQYDYLPILENMRGKDIVYMDCPHRDGRYQCDSLITDHVRAYYKHVNNFQIYPKVRMSPIDWPERFPRDSVFRLPVAIYNPYPFDINYSACTDFKATFGIGFSKDKRAGNPTTHQHIPFTNHRSGETLVDTLIVRSPAEPGEYNIVYGIRYEEELPGRNALPYPAVVY